MASEYWTVDIRYIEDHLLGPDPIYSISIMDNFSRAILSSALSPKQDLTAYLIVLYVRYNQGIRHRFLRVDEKMR